MKHLLYRMYVVCGLIALMSACGSTNENERVAPIVVDVEVQHCEVSPGAKYVSLGMRGFHKDIYDLDTGEAVELPSIPKRVKRTHTKFWVYPEAYFVATPPEEQGIYPPVFTDGWIVDVENQVITDLLDLDAVTRQATLTQINTEYVRQKTTISDYISPDGRFKLLATAIVTASHPPGPVTSYLVKFEGMGNPCNNPWKADSTGAYFAEISGMFAKDGGPIRLLRVPEEYLTPTPAAK